MNKTTNYQLNQWVKDDQVRMEDFNADNAKIDAAIKAVNQRADSLGTGKADKTALNALSARVDAVLAELRTKSFLVPLMETQVTSSAGVTKLSLNVSGVDWSQWQEVALDICLPKDKAPSTKVDTGDVVCSLHLLNNNNNFPYIATIHPDGLVYRYMFYCFAAPANRILIHHPAYTSYINSTSTFQELKVIQCYKNSSGSTTATEKYLPGCWMKLYGVR